MSIKLVFPGGEHPQVLLGPGVSRVGSDPHATIVINRPGVQPEHCQLHVNDHGVVLEVPPGTSVEVNGRRVSGLISLRPGDSVSFDGVRARVAAFDAHGATTNVALPHPANDDPGLTMVRPVMPMFVLRGLSGGVFGRSYPLDRPLTVGRSPECDVCISDPGLSRVHARLVPADDGVRLEDQESTNGSFLNGHRVRREIVTIGDEIAFDKVRFRLVGSGPHAHHEVPAPAATASPAPAARKPAWRGPVIAATMAALLASVAALVYL